MSPRRATGEDIPAICAFLRRHIQTSMFPLTNLEAHGVGSDAPRGLTCWLFEQAGEIAGVYSQTNEGMAMPQVPGLSADQAETLRKAGAGGALIGMLGATAQVRALQAAWGLGGAPSRHDADEPGYALDLADLIIPPAPPGTVLRLLTQADMPIVLPWRTSYHVEALGTPLERAEYEARRDLERCIPRGSHRLLVAGETPLAITGFSATLYDVVQIGGVYTPPEARGRGLARRALALHLDEARGEGVTHAVLFAASRSAARAYEAIGFCHVGPFTMLLFDDPVRTA